MCVEKALDRCLIVTRKAIIRSLKRLYFPGLHKGTERSMCYTVAAAVGAAMNQTAHCCSACLKELLQKQQRKDAR